jgi:hypothetical protein
MEAKIKEALTSELQVSVETVGKIFGLGRNSTYAAVKSGQIPSIKIGGRIVVPTAPLRKMLGIESK